jgi:hypothetical protein
MKIIKIIVDHKPDNCMACPLKHDRNCGKPKCIQEDTSGVMVIKVPDNRCFLNEI